MERRERIFPTRGVVLTLLLIVGVGAFLRFYGLGKQSLWNDELSHWVRSHHDSLAAVIHDCAVSDVHPPGDHVLMYFVERYVGESEWALRLPAAISGVLALVAIYLVGVRLYSPRVGLIAAAFMAVLWCPIYYSQEARPYSMLVLFASLSVLFWSGMVRRLLDGERIRIATAVAYVLVAIIASYLHYFGLLFIGLQAVAGVVVFARKRRAILSLGLVYLPVVLAYVPWVPTLWAHLHHEAVYIPRPGILAAGSYLLFLYNWSKWLTLAVVGLYAFLLAADVRTLVENRRQRRPMDAALRADVWVGLWLAVPFALVFLKSVVSVPVLANKNLIVSMPAAYLLLARAIERLPVRPVGRAGLTVVIAGVLLLHLIFAWGYYSTPQKEQFREAAGFLVERDHPGDNSLVLACAWGAEYSDYYLERQGSARRVDALARRASDIPRVTRLIRTRAPHYVWYLRGSVVPEHAFLEFLERDLRLVEHKAFLGADVWLFETRHASPDQDAAQGANETGG